MTTTPPAAIGGDELAKALRDAYGQGCRHAVGVAPESSTAYREKRDAWIRQYVARLAPAGEPDRDDDGAEVILWCMHVAGPDDVHAAPDFWTGLVWAAELNAFFAARAEKEGWAADENWPLIQATVQRWTGSAERHATSLARELSERREHAERRAKVATPDMLAALRDLVDLCAFGASGDAFRNGVTDSTGMIDEGDARASSRIAAARAAIAKAETGGA